MKKIALSILSAASLATLATLAPDASAIKLLPPPPPPTLVAANAYCASNSCTVSNFTQVTLAAAGQTLESFDLTFNNVTSNGGAVYGAIGVHHIAPTPGIHGPQGNVVMLHGDLFDFKTAFLEEQSASPYLSMPEWLAGSGVDVWGIDLRWTRVPATESDYSFMADWGIERDVEDVSNALGAIRSIRGDLTFGSDPVNLLGWSRGGIIGYALLDAESQLSASARNVGGFIPVDIYLKTDDASLKQHACNRLAGELALLNGSPAQYQDSTGYLVSYTGAQVLNGQGAATCLLPACSAAGLSNNDLAGLVGTATFSLVPDPFGPLYHFTAGSTDIAADTFSLTFTDHDSLLNMEAGAAPFQPLQIAVDTDTAICDDPLQVGVDFDDHLGDVTVPVLYVGAAGGIGTAGEYTLTYLGSSDVSTYEISTGAPTVLEFGHVDIFHTRTDQATIWSPIQTWIRNH